MAKYGRNIFDRFQEKIEKIPFHPCWEWAGLKDESGYGVFHHRKTRFGDFGLPYKNYFAHRLSMHFYRNFDLNPKVLVCHKCDNPGCVNPDHMFLGSIRDNILDAVQKKRHIRLERHPGAKLNISQVIEIRKMLNEGIAQSDIAIKFEVNPATISDIFRKITWNLP